MKQKNIFIFFAILISIIIFSSALVNAGSRITSDYSPFFNNDAKNIYYNNGEYYSILNTSVGIYVFYSYLVNGYYQIGYQISNDSGGSWSALTQLTFSEVNDVDTSHIGKVAPRVILKDNILYVFYETITLYSGGNIITLLEMNLSDNSVIFENLTFSSINRYAGGIWDIGILSNQTMYFWFHDDNHNYAKGYDAYYVNRFMMYYFNETTNLTSNVINEALDIHSSYDGTGQSPRGNIKVVFYNDTYFVVGVSYSYFNASWVYLGGYPERYGEVGNFYGCNGWDNNPNQLWVYLSDNSTGGDWIGQNFTFADCYYNNFFHLFFDANANLHLIRGYGFETSPEGSYLLTHERRTKASGLWTQISIDEFYNYPANLSNDIFNYEYFNYINGNSSFGMNKGTYFQNEDGSLYGFLYPNRDGGINYAIYNYTTSSFIKGVAIEGVSCNTDYFFPQLTYRMNMQYNNGSNMLHIGVVRLADSTCLEWRVGVPFYDWLPLVNTSANYLEYYDFNIATYSQPATPNCTNNQRVNTTCNCGGYVIDACYVDSLNCFDTWCCLGGFVGTSAQCFAWLSGGTNETSVNTSGGTLNTPDTANIANMFGLLTANQKLLAGTISLLVIGIACAVMGFGGFVIIIILVLGIVVFYAMGFLPAWLLYLLAILGVSGLAVTARNMFGAGGQ